MSCMQPVSRELQKFFFSFCSCHQKGPVWLERARVKYLPSGLAKVRAKWSSEIPISPGQTGSDNDPRVRVWLTNFSWRQALIWKIECSGLFLQRLFYFIFYLLPVRAWVDFSRINCFILVESLGVNPTKECPHPQFWISLNFNSEMPTLRLQQIVNYHSEFLTPALVPTAVCSSESLLW